MRAVYDHGAAAYIATTGDLELFPGLENELIRFGGRTPGGGTVLDLGCGVGRDTEWLDAQGFLVVAGDLSHRMLQIGAQRVPAIDHIQLDMTALPFRDGVFVGAWVCASMIHLPNGLLPAALTELCRVLRPGGAAAISMKEGRGEGWLAGSRLSEERWFTHVNRHAFADLMQEAGFVRIATVPSGRGKWFVAEGVRNPSENSTHPDHSPGISA
ncbi:class I SAM-dependent methyltransferase [Amycolatopsis sp. NPDC003861]